jgi:deferrochelatase/peroxidase EfeB
MGGQSRGGPLTRRRFLGSAAGAGVAGIAGATALGRSTRSHSGPASEAAWPLPAQRIAFHGEHQAGITSPATAAALMASFDVVADDRAEVRALFEVLTAQFASLMSGTPVEDRGANYPPLSTGAFGEHPPPTNLALTVAVGASMFDDRFGLRSRRPRELVSMPAFPNDRLDPDRCHGDVLINVAADSADACLFALRQVMRATRATLVLRWMVEGFNRLEAAKPGQAQVRNLLGFKDGTANLATSDEHLMDQHVWVRPDDDEPAWCVGGSYQVARQIRMLVESWDRTQLTEQERLIGRHKDTGAPLGTAREADDPGYPSDPKGHRVPLQSHIRLANPRTARTRDNLILRRGFSYSRGFDDAGRLDQGLAFVSFQRSLTKGFIAVQERLDGEPLEEYIRPEGGGYFFALPGSTGRSDYLGRALLA